MKYESPLRYPGGKSGLAPFLERVIELNDLRGCAYYEPFTGGAGAALKLLARGAVDELHLNDADPCVYAFWKSILLESERFVEKIFNIPLTIDEWKKQKVICIEGNKHSVFDLGFATFFMNRCNRSGILTGSGPIGGYEQKGRWGIDARFSRENLAERILRIGKLQKRIHMENKDAVRFLVDVLPRGSERERVFVYLDPPYFKKGSRLYMNYYEENDHRSLAEYVLRQHRLHWVMSYDNSTFIRKLYKVCCRHIFSLQYSLQRRREGEELLITPLHVKTPVCISVGTREIVFREEIV